MSTQATRRAIVAQMKENTGAAFIDSGDHYGRNHERNRECGVKFGGGPRIDECGAAIPVQDYMEHCFSRTPDAVALEKELKRRVRKAYPDEPVGLCFSEQGAIREALEVMGCDADGEHSGWKWWNTYNDETDLSQVLQLVTFRRGDKDFAIVQVHGGCDVRGGYTDGKVYEVPEFYNLFDVRAEVEAQDGTGPDSLYSAEQSGAKWDEKAKLWKWKDGTPCDWHIPALEYYGYPDPVTA